MVCLPCREAEGWCDRGFMKYNEDKHEVLHIGRNGHLQPQGAAVLRGHGGLGREQSEHGPAAFWAVITGENKALGQLERRPPPS